MRISRCAVLSGFFAATVSFVSLLPGGAHAEGKSKLFTIPDDDGYGLGECFSPGASCGQVVANAFCEANGWGAALAFGRADDVTAGIVKASTANPRAKSAFVVNCSE